MFDLLQRQFLRDLRASWAKTCLLGVLLLVGLCFWVPPLIRAVGGGPAKRPTATRPSKPAAAPAAPAPPADTQTRSLGGWQHSEELRETDPLVRSVEVAAIRSNPFRIDPQQFPPPILFADEPKEVPRRPASPRPAAPAPGDTPEGLTLRSTIVGVQRRAAYINQKLYYEGADLMVNGEMYHLAAVHPRKVVLRRGENVYELKLAPAAPPGAEAPPPGQN